LSETLVNSFTIQYTLYKNTNGMTYTEMYKHALNTIIRSVSHSAAYSRWEGMWM